MACCRCQEHCQRWPGNPKCQSKFQKYHAVRRNLRLWDHEWCSYFDGNGCCHGLSPSSSKEWLLPWTLAVIFQRGSYNGTLSTSKTSQRWPCNPSDRSKFTNIVHTFEIYVYEIATVWSEFEVGPYAIKIYNLSSNLLKKLELIYNSRKDCGHKGVGRKPTCWSCEALDKLVDGSLRHPVANHTFGITKLRLINQVSNCF